MVRTVPYLAALFLVSALSLAGVPPLSGFVSKFSLIDAGIAGKHYEVVAVSLVVSLLTLFAMVRIWGGAFWSPPEPDAPPAPVPSNRAGGPALMVAATTAVVACSLAIAAAAGPIYSFSERTGRDLLDRNSYIDEVLSP
jgi:multicomponent Na+:H+ antiporter subunit D